MVANDISGFVTLGDKVTLSDCHYCDTNLSHKVTRSREIAVTVAYNVIDQSKTIRNAGNAT